MPIDIFTSSLPSLFYISPLANTPTTVNVGSNLNSSDNQTSGPYTGRYKIIFKFERP